MNRRLTGLVWRNSERIIVLLIGSTVLVFGGVLLFLPGPASIVIPIGLAILATEFVWSRRLLRRVEQKANELVRVFESRNPG